MPRYRGDPNRWVSSACEAGIHDACSFPRYCDCCYERAIATVFGVLGVFGVFGAIGSVLLAIVWAVS